MHDIRVIDGTTIHDKIYLTKITREKFKKFFTEK